MGASAAEQISGGQMTRGSRAYRARRRRYVGTCTWDRFRLCLPLMVFAPVRRADWWLALTFLGHSGADELGRYVEDPETGSAFEAAARRVPDRLPAP